MGRVLPIAFNSPPRFTPLVPTTNTNLHRDGWTNFNGHSKTHRIISSRIFFRLARFGEYRISHHTYTRSRAANLLWSREHKS